MKEILKGIRAEWKKISWPDKKEMVKKTSAVVASSIALGGLIAGMDFIFQNGVNFVLSFF